MTNREAHEEAAGMGLDDSFFIRNKIDADAQRLKIGAPSRLAEAEEHSKKAEERFSSIEGRMEVLDCK